MFHVILVKNGKRAILASCAFSSGADTIKHALEVCFDNKIEIEEESDTDFIAKLMAKKTIVVTGS